MVNYVPPPKDLSRLNPIQRYLQKGSLDWSDYIRLAALVLVYWLLRPYFQRFFKNASKDVQAGEEEEEAYKQRRAQAALSDDLRNVKDKGQGKTLGELLDANGDEVAAQSTGINSTTNVEVKSRKQSKKKGVSFAPEKSEADKTLDWEDDSEFDPRRPPFVSEGGKAQSGDIKAWMEKWTGE